MIGHDSCAIDVTLQRGLHFLSQVLASCTHIREMEEEVDDITLLLRGGFWGTFHSGMCSFSWMLTIFTRMVWGLLLRL